MKDRLLKVTVMLRSSRSEDSLHRQAYNAFNGIEGVMGVDKVIVTEIAQFRRWPFSLEEIPVEKRLRK